MASTIVAMITVVSVWVILEEYGLTQAMLSCLDSVNDTSTCCQCSEHPVVYHCPGACLQGFYNSNEAVGNCTSAGTQPNTTTTANALSVQYVTCAPCHPACDTCTDQGPDKCRLCADGYTRQDNTTANCTKTIENNQEADRKIIVIVVATVGFFIILLSTFICVRFKICARIKYSSRVANLDRTLKDRQNSSSFTHPRASGLSYKNVELSGCRDTSIPYENISLSRACEWSSPSLLPETAVDSVTPKRVPSSDKEPITFSREISFNSSDIERSGEKRRASETSTKRETDTATRISRSLSQAETEAELGETVAESSYGDCCLTEEPSRQQKSAIDKGKDLGISDTGLCCVESTETAANHHHSVTDVLGSPVRSCRSDSRLFDCLPMNNDTQRKTNFVGSSLTLTSDHYSNPDKEVSSTFSRLNSTTGRQLSLLTYGPFVGTLAELSARSDSFGRIFTNTLTSATQTAWSDEETDAVLPVCSEGWQFCKEFSPAGGALQGEHSDVRLDIPENAVEKGNRLTIRGAVCTDIVNAHKKLEVPAEEFMRSPVIEYSAGKDYTFQKPVCIVLPHFLPPGFLSENVRVYRFNRSTSGEILIEPLRLQPRQKNVQAADIKDPSDEDTGVYFFGDNNIICIFTDHFSGYFCTHCKQNHEPPVLLLQLFAKHVETTESERLVDIRLEVWDNRWNIKDFRENKDSTLMRQMQRVDSLRHLPAVENEGDLANLALGMRLELLTEDDELRWKHCVRKNGEILRPVEQTVEIKGLCQCQPAIPYINYWKLTNRQPAAPDDFTCIVDVGYVASRAKPIVFAETLGFETYDIRIRKSLEAVGTTAEPLVSPCCVIKRADNVYLSPSISSQSSSRSTSAAMSESTAASESESSQNRLSDMSTGSSSSTSDGSKPTTNG